MEDWLRNMKKVGISLAALSLIAVFGGAIALHPGVAFAETPLASLEPTTFKASAGYTLDPMHTSIGFDIEHLGLSRVQGRFDRESGHLQVDPQNISESSVEVTIQTASIDTAVAPRDADLRSPNFFDVVKYPVITFKSSRIRKEGKHYVADGDLTIKGVKKNISIPFQVFGPVKDPFGGIRIGVVSSPIAINRQEFGITYNQRLPDGKLAVGNEVTIRLSFEASLDKPK